MVFSLCASTFAVVRIILLEGEEHLFIVRLGVKISEELGIEIERKKS